MTVIIHDKTEIERVRILVATGSSARDLASSLAQYDDFSVIAGSCDGARTIELMRRHRPDVMLIDLQLPRAVATIQSILREFSQIKIVVLDASGAGELIYDAIGAGAKAGLLADAKVEEIAMTFRLVMSGHSWLSPGVAVRIIEEFKRMRQGRAVSAPRERLTMRENEVVKLVAEGKSNTEIAVKLHLSEGTVKNYVSAIMEKCRAKNRTELAIRAVVSCVW
jgi:DNA-binding NarL/FixJ family response regulator